MQDTEAVGTSMIDTKTNIAAAADLVNHEIVKTRKEVLAEQRYESKVMRKTRDGKRSKNRRAK